MSLLNSGFDVRSDDKVVTVVSHGLAGSSQRACLEIAVVRGDDNAEIGIKDSNFRNLDRPRRIWYGRNGLRTRHPRSMASRSGLFIATSTAALLCGCRTSEPDTARDAQLSRAAP